MLEPDPANRPDEQCIMTYLSEFPRAFLNKMEEDIGHVGVIQGSYHVDEQSMKSSIKQTLEEDPRVKEREIQARQAELQAEMARQELEAIKQAQAQRDADDRRRKELEEAQKALDQIEAKRRREEEDARMAAQLAAQQRAAEDQMARMREENERLKMQLTQLKSSVIGKLKVVVVSARGIPATDIVYGKSDPYVTLTLERQKEKTKTVKHTLTPVWNASYTFYVSDANAELVATLWDWERFRRDAFMGCVTVLPKDLTPGVEKEAWYPLVAKKAGQKVKGELSLRLLLTKE